MTISFTIEVTCISYTDMKKNIIYTYHTYIYICALQINRHDVVDLRARQIGCRDTRDIQRMGLGNHIINASCLVGNQGLGVNISHIFLISSFTWTFVTDFLLDSVHFRKIQSSILKK